MNRIRFISIAIFISLLSACSVTQKLPAKKEVLKTVTLANEYFMNKWPDPGKDNSCAITQPHLAKPYLDKSCVLRRTDGIIQH